MTDMRLSRIADLVLAGLALAAIFSELPRVLPSDGLWDFGSFVASGRAAREGLNPYGVYPLTLHVVLPGFDAWNPNLNPPISALLFRLFDVVAPERMFRIWWAVSMLCWAATVFVLVRRKPAPQAWTQAVWAFGLAGFWDTLLLGQIYVPFALAAAGAWVLLERGSGTLAGILIGLVVAMKPNFLVWPALLFLSGHRRPALLAVGTAAAISAVPRLVYGPEIYRQWFELLAADRDRAFFLTNASLAGLTARIGSTTLGLALGLVLLAGLALWAFLRRPGAMRASAFGVLASLIASPIAWIHYTLFLAPVVLSRWEKPGMRLVAAMLLVPVPFIIGQFGKPPLVQATLGSVYNWALVLCAVVLALGGEHEGAPGRADATVPKPESPLPRPRAA